MNVGVVACLGQGVDDVLNLFGLAIIPRFVVLLAVLLSSKISFRRRFVVKS